MPVDARKANRLHPLQESAYLRCRADVFESRIRELLAAYPAMSATVIAERVGWERGLTGFEGPGAGAAPGLPAGGHGQPDRLWSGQGGANDFRFLPGQINPFDHARDLAL